MRVLIIDDEADLIKALKTLLTDQQYDVDTALDGMQGLEMAQAGIYDLLIVDVMLPRLNGLDLVRTLREEGDATPILLLTARDSVADRVQGLDSGADDYLVKPFSFPELFARVRALTRRAGEIVGVRQISAGVCSLDLVNRTFTCQGAPVSLTHKEFQLMELFLRNPGRVLTKDLLYDRIWGFEADVDSNVLEAYIHFLRKKLENHRNPSGNAASPLIETVRGVGYVFRER
jgi:DNA-binding response OmpR family regulator